jgi:hypothetical protein
MKKTTLSVFMLLSAAFAFAKGGQVAQIAGSNGKPEQKTATVKTIPQQITQSSARVGLQTNQTNVAFYTEDFAGGIPAGWSNVDAAGNGVVWTATTTGAVNTDTLSTVGTTAANGYLIFDSDGSGASVGGEDGILTTSAIDCSGKPLVMLELNEYFAQYVASTGVISVSNDSTTWTEVHHAEDGLAGNTATLNPLALAINISAVAGNQATVYIRFEYIGDWDYYWMIDDLVLSEPPSVNAAIVNVPLDFNGCSLSATTAVMVEIKNMGATPLTNFDITYVADGGTPVTETYTGTINFDESATHTFTSTVDFSVAGIHQIDAYIGVAGDTDLSNDTLSAASISYDHIDLTAGAYTMGFEASEDFTAYTLDFPDGDVGTFDISPDYTHSGIACLRKVGTGAPDDKWVFTQCVDILSGGTYTLTYYYKNFDLTAMCSLETYIGASNTVADMTTLIVQNPLPTDTTYQMSSSVLSVPPGTYTIGFHFYSSAALGTSSLRLDDISIDFDDAVTENIASSLISVYPNPTNGKVNIQNKNANDKNFTVSVINSLGSVVLVENFESLSNETIDLSSQPAGIYSVKLQSASTTVNKSVVLTK